MKVAMPPRAIRHDDAGTSSTIAFLVAAAMFTSGLVFLLQFEADPVSTARPGHTELRVKAHDALGVLVGSTGSPGAWSSGADVSAVKRLGLLERGTARTLDRDKFDALVNGARGLTPGVDYASARDLLGLDGYSFNVRASPLVHADAPYGMERMDAYRIAYVGQWAGSTESTASAREAKALADLPVTFTDKEAPDGDKYRDRKQEVRSLIGKLGDNIVVEPGVDPGTLPDAQFRRLDTARLQQTDPRLSPYAGDHVLGIAGRTGGPRYDDDTDMRAILGTVDLSAVTDPVIRWREIVEGEYDQDPVTEEITPIDYGVVEVRVKGTTDWVPLNPADGSTSGVPSVTTGYADVGPAWVERTLDVDPCACAGATEVDIAIRWVSDEDETNLGWLVDDFRVESRDGTENELHLLFDPPEYDAVIIGSGVSHNALTPSGIKYGLRDFVRAGGDLFVLGGSASDQWLQPVYDVGVKDATGVPVTFPDVRQPVLVWPTPLDYVNYPTRNAAWDLKSAGVDDFEMVAGRADASTSATWAVSKPGAVGDGHLMLTTYAPTDLAELDARLFLANNLMYAYYRDMFLEYGPAVPEGAPVASATATAVMDRSRTGAGEYVDMLIVMHMWR